MIKKFYQNMKTFACLCAFLVAFTHTAKAQITNQPPTASPASICGTGTATISIPSSQAGVTYGLVASTNTTALVGSPVSGTGNALNFPTGTVTVNTTYAVVGIIVGTSTVVMNPYATVTVNALPTVMITPSHTAICKGAIDTLTASGAVNYTWTPGGSTATSETVAPTSTTTPTSYTLTGTDANGCTNTAVQAITVNAVPTVNIAGGPGFGGVCPGTTTTYTASGATTYVWAPGGLTTSTISVSPSATTVYTVTGTNASGCSAVKTRTLTVNPSATVTISGPSFICNGSAGTLSASGATTYTWSNNATTTSISVSPTVTTTYSVVSGAGFGSCPGTAFYTLTVTPNPPPTVTISGSTVTCSGQTDLLTASGATTYTWNTGATTATISPTPTVSTNYTVTGTDASGCTNVSTLSVTVNGLPNITVTGTNTICIGNSTTLTATGATTYTWSSNAASTTTSTVVVNPTTTDVYTVTGTNANGCISVKTRTVTVNALPTLTVTPQTICTGATATLTAAGANTYTWSAGLSNTNGTTVTGSPTVSTTYSVSGTNTSGCVGTTTTSIDVVTSLTVTAVASSSVTCAGSPVTLTGLGASSYSWTSGGGTISGATGTTVTVTPVGPTTTYTLNGSSGTCTTTPYVLSVGVNATPTVTASAFPNDTICTGSTVTLTGSGASTYSWSNGVTDGVVYTPSVTATYTVTGTDANGCKGTATQKVTLNALPTVNMSTGGASGGICPGITATLTASGATTYTWSTAATTTVITVTPTVTTTYTVYGSNAFGCVGSRVRTIPLNPTPTATISAPAAICAGQTATLTAVSTNTVTVTSYSWSTGSTTVTTTDAPTTTATYTLLVAGTQCTDTVKTTVNVGALPTLSVTASSNPICKGLTDTLKVTGATTYTWHPTGSHAASLVGPANASVTFTVIGSNGGCLDSINYAVTVNPLPIVGIVSNPSNDTICTGANVTLSGSGATNYVWTGGITDAIAFTPTATATYSVTGTDANNCSKTSSVQVVVNSCSTGINTLNGITAVKVYPNPSNGNVFIQVDNIANTSVEVFNALGEMVYTKALNSNLENVNLEKLNAGVYFIHVKQNGAYIYRSNIMLSK
jgi:hypothetical protein